MINSLSKLLVSVLRLPAEPPAPFGEEASLRVFRAAPQFLTYQTFVWAIGQAALLVGFLFVEAAIIAAAVASKDTLGTILLNGAALLGAAAYAPFVIVTYLSLRLQYEFRWYKVTDRSLRIREGVFLVREMTMTFANIQNMEVSQGPIQRWLGIADLKVQTAGGGAAATQRAHGQKGHQVFNMHLGYFRGVDNAAEILSLMQERLRKYRSSGLGDLDDHSDHSHAPAGAAATSDSLLTAASALLAETRALRSAADNLRALRD